MRSWTAIPTQPTCHSCSRHSTHSDAIAASTSSWPGTLSTAVLSATVIDSLLARNGCSRLFSCVIASASGTSPRQNWNARLYVAKSLERHALVSLIESSTTSTSRVFISWIISPSHGAWWLSAFFCFSTRTSSVRFWQNLATTSSLKYMSCLTRPMYGLSTSNDAAYIDFLSASEPLTVGCARGR